MRFPFGLFWYIVQKGVINKHYTFTLTEFSLVESEVHIFFYVTI